MLLEIETDGELASRAAVASSFFMALFHASRSLAGKAATCPGGVDRGSLDSASGCMLVATRFQDVAVAALPACSAQLHLAVKQLHRQLDRECRFTALGPELLSKLKSLTLHMQDL